MRYPRLAKALLVASLGCALGLWWGFQSKLDYWEVMHFVVLLHGGLLTATLASALTWRSDGRPLKVAPRLLAVGLALVWVHTWCEPLQRLVVWLSMERFLWLQV